jgi:glutaredoxin 3
MKVSGESGAVLDWMMDPTGTHISSVSAALEHDGKLFLGNLAGDYVSYVDLQKDQQKQKQQQGEQGVHAQRRKQGAAAKSKQAGFLVFADAAAVEEAAAAAGEVGEGCNADSQHGFCANPAVIDADENSEGGSEMSAEADNSDMSDADRALLYIHSKVHHNKVVVFSKSYCPFCRKAKNALLKFLNPEQFTVVELDLLHELPEGDEGRAIAADVLQDALQTVTGRRTVPRVFIGGTFVGGGDDMDSMAQTGRLRAVLQEQGLLLAEE